MHAFIKVIISGSNDHRIGEGEKQVLKDMIVKKLTTPVNQTKLSEENKNWKAEKNVIRQLTKTDYKNAHLR